jgi:hypothetical protein
MLLVREEYIEQAYFFRAYRERLEDDTPSQEILLALREEILATTSLPMAIDILRGEVLLKGRLSTAMSVLSHYFTPFQTFVLKCSEEDLARFDQRTALMVLEREAQYRTEDRYSPAGLFIYQFECLSRNRLGYADGLRAVATDPAYSEDWRTWILRLGQQIGTAEFGEFLYFRSEEHVAERRRDKPDYQPTVPILFGRSEGRIARANRGKDPLYLFAALQRQLGYPAVPRPPRQRDFQLHPELEARLQRLEKRMQLAEQEQKGKFDLSEFYAKQPKFTDEGVE